MTDIVKSEEYAIIKHGDRVTEVLADNLGGEKIGPLDLPRIKVPAGGGVGWEVPTLDGTEVAQELVGVIIFHQIGRLYWKVPLDEGGGNQPPDCWSEDGVYGTGLMADRISSRIGRRCKCEDDCPMSKFGTDPKGGRGQACKQSRKLFLIRPSDMMPVHVQIPPTSLQNSMAYMLRLTGAGKRYTDVLTRLKLEKATNRAGIVYAKVVFTAAGELPPDHAETFHKLRKQLEPSLRKVRTMDGAGAPEPPSEPEDDQ